MEHTYLIRFGIRRQVGWFAAGPDELSRGQAVVVRTGRGTELGEVVAESPAAAGVVPAARVIRPAGPDDLDRARRAADECDSRFEACRRAFADGIWPIEPVDLEPLLDDGRAVLHYLGPHRLDAAGLGAALRERCGFEPVFEPVGPDVDPVAAAPEPAGCGAEGCGGGGCGSGGGDEAAGSGCASCALPALAARRRAR